DLGLTSFLTDSNGAKVKPPKFFVKSQNQLAIEQRKLSKCEKGSNRRQIQRSVVGRIHERIANQRKDWLHKTSTTYTKIYDFIAVEDLEVKKMLANRIFSKSISDAGWSIFTNMLAYKMQILGQVFVKVPPQYTSQDCSNCGDRVQKSLSVRTHVCPCGYIADRDENAARNILQAAKHWRTARVAR